MKNILLFLSMIIALNACKKNNEVTPNRPPNSFINIPDANFEQALIGKKIDKDGLVNGKMDFDDAKGVENLEIDSLQIKSLTGIEAFIDLKYLDCGDNELSNLDISKNVKLQTLWCSNNQLSNWDISKNVYLIDLWCSNNQLRKLDVSKNVKLKYLACSNNQLGNLDISKNVELEILSCQNNQLNNLDISKNMKLWYLDCYNNQIKTICVADVAQTHMAWQDATAEYKVCQ